MLRRLARYCVYVTVLCLVAVAWLTFHDAPTDKDAAEPAGPGASPQVHESSAPPSRERQYSNLTIFPNGGNFGGKITIHNPTDRDFQIMVTVNLYDGDQNVGSVTGLTAVKPHSDPRVELDGYDAFTTFTETRVSMSGFPI